VPGPVTPQPQSRKASRRCGSAPFDSLIHLPYFGLAHAYLVCGRYEEAALAAGRAMQASPQFSPPCAPRIVALVNLGRNEEVRASAERLLQLNPGFRISEGVWNGPERRALMADALRRAGLPE
jgi:tetratricopeptide (TPR) repeat protein